MGKIKLNLKSSMKISKEDHKKQISSLTRILRPKVYITDSSTFKSLVQQLTGNGTSPPATTIPQVPVPQNFPSWADSPPELSSMPIALESSPEPTFTSTASESSSDNSLAVHNLYDHDQPMIHYDVDMKWLFEIDLEKFPDHHDSNGYAPISLSDQQQEVCVYDYELSGLIW
ncbi:hypothetical protein Acr_23g0011020 [Actinidia rufa]|uniref:VQ domain-containing protein n=1 Tax=Actinidia rufa TaxID=165716 RepID=A0A7J0GPH1_9ERIC|nr:hypothetical protein Acr_23g0011020 [Actinidia rufa]